MNLRNFFKNILILGTMQLSTQICELSRNYYYGGQIYCENIDIQKFNEFKIDNFDKQDRRIIKIENSNLTDITAHVFNSYYNVDDFEISNSNVQSIHLNAFNQGTKTINLMNNQMTILNSTTFKNLTRLRELNLCNNRITKFVLGCFKDLYWLINLDLSNNNISILQSEIFNGLKNIDTLNLSNNKILKFPLGCFQYLETLKALNLSRNYIENIEIGIFYNLRNLEYLNLSNNKIKSVTPGVFYDLHNIKFLVISYNYLCDAEGKNMFLSLFKSHAFTNSYINFDVDGNNWSCEFLLNLIENYQYLKLELGTIHNETNVNGIPCKIIKLKNFVDNDLQSSDKNQTIMNYNYFNSIDTNLMSVFNGIILTLILVTLISMLYIFVKYFLCNNQIRLKNAQQLEPLF